MKENIYIFRFSFFIFILSLWVCESSDNSEESDVWFCANQQCSDPISIGVAQLKYAGPKKNRIPSIKAGSKVKVFKKSLNHKLWFIEANGKKGLIPESFVTEKKILFKREHLKIVSDKKEEKSVETHFKEHECDVAVKEPNKLSIISSFPFPGSVAESFTNNDIKQNVQSKTVNYDVIDGTKLYRSDISQRADILKNSEENKETSSGVLNNEGKDGTSLSSDSSALDKKDSDLDVNNGEVTAAFEKVNDSSSVTPSNVNDSQESGNNVTEDKVHSNDEAVNNGKVKLNEKLSVIDSIVPSGRNDLNQKDIDDSDGVQDDDGTYISESESEYEDVSDRINANTSRKDVSSEENVESERTSSDPTLLSVVLAKKDVKDLQPPEKTHSKVVKTTDKAELSPIKKISENTAVEGLKNNQMSEEVPLNVSDKINANTSRKDVSSEENVKSERNSSDPTLLSVDPAKKDVKDLQPPEKSQSEDIEDEKDQLTEKTHSKVVKRTDKEDPSPDKMQKVILKKDHQMSEEVQLKFAEKTDEEDTSRKDQQSPEEESSKIMKETDVESVKDQQTPGEVNKTNYNNSVELNGTVKETEISEQSSDSLLNNTEQFTENKNNLAFSKLPISNKIEKNILSQEQEEKTEIFDKSKGSEHVKGTPVDEPSVEQIHSSDVTETSKYVPSSGYILQSVFNNVKEAPPMTEKDEELVHDSVSDPATQVTSEDKQIAFNNISFKENFTIQNEIESTTQASYVGIEHPLPAEVEQPTEDPLKLSKKTFKEEEENAQQQSEYGIASNDQKSDLEEEAIHNKTEGIVSWFNFNLITNLFLSTYQQFSQPSDEANEVVSEEKLEEFTDHQIWKGKKKLISEQEQYCSLDENGEDSCKQFQNLEESLPLSNKEDGEDVWVVLQYILSSSQTISASTDSLIYLIITSVTLIIFSLGYYYIENHRQDGALVAKINILERDLLVAKKKAAVLQEKLQSAESEISLDKETLSEHIERIKTLTQQLEEITLSKADLEEQYAVVLKECEAATESGFEMHCLLTEALSTQDGSKVLVKTVENLTEKLDRQGGEIKELNQLISKKSEEIVKLQETVKVLKEKLTTVSREKEEQVLQLSDKNRELSTQLENLMEQKSVIESKLSNEVSRLRLIVEDTQTKLANCEGEVDALRDAIAKLNKHEKEEDLEILYDTAKVSSKLVIAEKERDNYKEKFLEEEGARKLLEDHVEMTRQEVKSLKENYEAAEKEKIEALTKLQVLSNYFKEKETQLQNELGLQESMWLQKQSDDHTIYEQMKSLREENEKFKLQNESLKKEICESESAFKIQIANTEQKAHDNWLASRQLERRLKETQNEATQLRNRLTLIEKNATNSSSDDLKQNMSFGMGETNGDPSSPPPTLPIFPPSTSPPFMMFGGNIPPPPPPTSEFLPPPPPPPLGFPEGRPAPVGRISSPPLDHNFSMHPPIPYFYDSTPYGSHHSPSPPPHRPMPKPVRDMGMDQKDRASPPRHPESQERTGRRSKR
ncbi:transport and golgi organization 1 [Lycorma delicatula]|uniref:transport and golgi organization 1 n=1 Tax=Lycorma delicatula TaxID=130591 RepID=UPI003F50DB71